MLNNLADPLAATLPTEAEAFKQGRRALSDLTRPVPARYWAEVLGTALVGWSALAGASSGRLGPLASLGLWAIAVLTMHRATTFLHELTHLRPGSMPGLRLAWNVLWGVPLLLPSWIYERMHLDHHRRRVLGTSQDPEYLPLAKMTPARVIATASVGLLLPVALVLRFVVVGPVSWLSPRLRRFVEARLSSLASNPAWRAPPMAPGLRRFAIVTELACSLWGWALLAGVVSGALPIAAVLVPLSAMFGTVALNQLRAHAAHRYTSTGEAMSEPRMFGDTINLTTGGVLGELLLPAGVGFHALHHFAPTVPFHHLRAAHQRLVELLPPGSSYHLATEPSLLGALKKLLATARVNSAPRPRVALVTGASSGFGLHAAVELARAGFRVFAAVRAQGRRGPLLEAARAAGVELETVELDVDAPASIASAVGQVAAAAGPIEVLVNNAGIAIGGFFEDQSSAEVRAQFETNLFGVMALTAAVLPAMRAARKGRIINVSSIGGRVGTPGLAPYCASKFAVEGFSESLRFELKPLGIDVVLVEPGTYGTAIFYENRRVAAAAERDTSVYAERLRATQAAMYADLTRQQKDPREVGVAIAAAALRRRPALRYTVGSDAHLAAWAARLLPQRLFERLVGGFYGRTVPGPTPVFPMKPALTAPLDLT